jgi:hypothetical protein
MRAFGCPAKFTKHSQFRNPAVNSVPYLLRHTDGPPNGPPDPTQQGGPGSTFAMDAAGPLLLPPMWRFYPGANRSVQSQHRPLHEYARHQNSSLPIPWRRAARSPPCRAAGARCIHHRGRGGTRRKHRNEKKGHRFSSVSSEPALSGAEGSSAVKVLRFFLAFCLKGPPQGRFNSSGFHSGVLGDSGALCPMAS